MVLRSTRSLPKSLFTFCRKRLLATVRSSCRVSVSGLVVIAKKLPIECQTCPALRRQRLEIEHAYHSQNEVGGRAGSYRSIRSSQVQTFGKVAQWLERLLQMRLSCPFVWRPTCPVRSYPIGGLRAPSSHTFTGALVQRSHLQVVLRSNRSLPTNNIFCIILFFSLGFCMSLQADSFKFGVL